MNQEQMAEIDYLGRMYGVLHRAHVQIAEFADPPSVDTQSERADVLVILRQTTENIGHALKRRGV